MVCVCSVSGKGRDTGDFGAVDGIDFSRVHWPFMYHLSRFLVCIWLGVSTVRWHGGLQVVKRSHYTTFGGRGLACISPSTCIVYAWHPGHKIRWF